MTVVKMEEISEVLEKVSNAKILTLDTETYWDSTKLLGIGICLDSTTSFYLPFGHEFALNLGEENLPMDVIGRLGTAIGNKPVIFHNAKFDLRVLREAGLRLETNTIHCTMLMSYYKDEYPPHGLEDLGLRDVAMTSKGDWLVKMDKMKKAGLAWHEIPPLLMGPYCESDTRITRALFDTYLPELGEWVNPEYYASQVMFGVNVLGAMEQRGILVDRNACQLYAEQCDQRMQEIRGQLGFDPSSRIQLARKLFSDVPVGLGLPVRSWGKPHSRSGQRQPTMNDEVLSTYSHPVVALVREFRQLQKQLSAFLLPWHAKSATDGKLHPTFKQHGTVTGRLSCENPNMQQIPRGSYLQDVFTAPPGYSLYEFDYSQQEYRLAAAYAQDPKITERLVAGDDFHSIVADQLGIDRQLAKIVNFLILYGGGVERLADQLNISWTAARTFLDNYHETYPRLKQVASKAESAAAAQGKVKYWSDRYRKFKWPSEYRKAFNSVIQGGCADITRQSLTILHHEGYEIVNQVHDAAWILLPNGSSEVPHIQSLMSDWCLETFGVPFPVDVKLKSVNNG